MGNLSARHDMQAMSQVSQLERSEAHVDRTEARAGRNGHVNAGEQGAVNRAESHASGKIYRDKHNGRVRG